MLERALQCSSKHLLNQSLSAALLQLRIDFTQNRPRSLVKNHVFWSACGVCAWLALFEASFLWRHVYCSPKMPRFSPHIHAQASFSTSHRYQVPVLLSACNSEKLFTTRVSMSSRLGPQRTIRFGHSGGTGNCAGCVGGCQAKFVGLAASWKMASRRSRVTTILPWRFRRSLTAVSKARSSIICHLGVHNSCRTTPGIPTETFRPDFLSRFWRCHLMGELAGVPLKQPLVAVGCWLQGVRRGGESRRMHPEEKAGSPGARGQGVP